MWRAFLITTSLGQHPLKTLAFLPVKHKIYALFKESTCLHLNACSIQTFSYLVELQHTEQFCVPAAYLICAY